MNRTLTRKKHNHGTDDYWDARLEGYVHMVQPGGFAIASYPDQILGTLLGSCVSACICDPFSGIGGLNHFLLPSRYETQGGNDRDAARYGVHAMEMLINELQKLGANRARLQAKLFGGAHIVDVSSGDSVGARNQKFATEFLDREGITITATNLGGSHARRIFFRPTLDKVLVMIPERSAIQKVKVAESQLRRRLPTRSETGQVELF
jgi:chemotaxis protein CheD